MSRLLFFLTLPFIFACHRSDKRHKPPYIPQAGESYAKAIYEGKEYYAKALLYDSQMEEGKKSLGIQGLQIWGMDSIGININLYSLDINIPMDSIFFIEKLIRQQTPQGDFVGKNVHVNQCCSDEWIGSYEAASDTLNRYRLMRSDTSSGEYELLFDIFAVYKGHIHNYPKRDTVLLRDLRVVIVGGKE